MPVDCNRLQSHTQSLTEIVCISELLNWRFVFVSSKKKNSEMMRPFKARVTAATSSRESPLKQKKSPLAFIKLKPQTLLCRPSSSCTFNRQKKRQTTAAVPPCCWWLSTHHHHYWSTTDHMQSDCRKQRQTAHCSLKVTNVMQILRKHGLNDARVSTALNSVRRRDWCRLSRLQQHPLGLLIDWRWGWREGVYCTSDCR